MKKKKYVELINGFVEYKKNSMLSYDEYNNTCLIFNNN